MEKPANKLKCRREFLRLLAGSPLLALGGLPRGPWERLMAQEVQPHLVAASVRGVPWERFMAQVQWPDGPPGSPDVNVTGRYGKWRDMGPDDYLGSPGVIKSPKDAENLFDFEEAASKNPNGYIKNPAHFYNLELGGAQDGGAQERKNRMGFSKWDIIGRRVFDRTHMDMSVNLFGTVYKNPIFLCPAGAHKAYNPLGELATAKGAATAGSLMILSTGSSYPIEEVNAARGIPVWFQLYLTDDFNVNRALLKRGQTSGCTVTVFTVDSLEMGGGPSTAERFGLDPATCVACHGTPGGGYAESVRHKADYEGIDVSNAHRQNPLDMSWDVVKRLRDTTTMKLVLKGIVSREDAQLAVEHGVDGLIVSNHGGHHAWGTRSTIEALSDVVDGVGGKIPVMIDSGFRRGTDVYKAMALGAKACGFGRPYLWGLGAFGQPGVEGVLDLMKREFLNAMETGGTTSLAKITRACVTRVS